MSDKRKVSTDALETLGTIIGENEKRDAIHLAVIPAKAGVILRAGMYIDLVNGIATRSRDGLGIVDPFVRGQIQIGQMFWMVLRPRTITSLRHVWSHPSLPDEPIWSSTIESDPVQKKANSELWLREFCETADCPSYEVVIAAAVGRYQNEDGDSGENEGEYLHFSGFDARGDIPDEFWDHVEIVTGQKVSSRATYFSCSC